MLELNLKIEELISSGAKDFEIAKVLKLSIKEYLNSLDDIFNDAGGKDFFVKHTKKIDAFIKILYKYLLRKHFGDFLPMSNSIPITLIALGSYGREQLCVYSDIDIMVLYKDIQGFNIKPIIEELMIIAWDSGLKLGSRVHELDEIEEAVKTDITIKTSILESRFIYGSKVLWYGFQNKLTNIRAYNKKEFIVEKLEEHKQRLLKYKLNMQPNIKDGYGGMRESNMLFWMATIIHGVKTTKDLVGIYFTEVEYKAYRSSLEYIFRIRNALHLIAKKKLDMVNFDVLPELSTKLGFQDTPRHVKERQCMSRLLYALHTVHNFTSIMIKKLIRPYIYKTENIGYLRQNRYKKNIYICDAKVYTSFSRKPQKLFDVLKELNDLPIDVRRFDNAYIYNIRKTILPNTLNTKTKQQIKLLLEKQNSAPLFKLLYNTNLFKEVIPSVKKILNQPQFDGYHRHPVDIHTLKALKHVQNIKDEFIAYTYKHLSSENKSLLNTLVLFHDIGKGRGKDHHIVGENIFRKFAKSIGMSDTNITIGARIVRYHNMMTKVATSEDIYSQKVILNFTGLLQTKETLDLLICLTYADINSVEKGIYKSSTASLLKELYLQSVNAFENKELVKDSTRRVQKENTIKKSKNFTSLSRLMQKKILRIDSNQLFLMYKAEDIISLALKAKDVTTIEYEIENTSVLTIKILRVSPLNLGYLLGKLSFLDISSMNIFKLYDEKKYFEIKFTDNIDNTDISFVDEIIKNSFDMTKVFKYKKPLIQDKEILIDCEHKEDVAQMKIQTKDKKGLFGYIAQVLDEYNIEIQSAKIFTKKDKVNDLLLIEKNGNFCINKDDILEKLITKE
ncbi:MAG TPA: HD domain-containing protein [Arcobacter sp.]|nr:HD domain-containing protein [Arcobacter sp.]